MLPVAGVRVPPNPPPKTSTPCRVAIQDAKSDVIRSGQPKLMPWTSPHGSIHKHTLQCTAASAAGLGLFLLQKLHRHFKCWMVLQRQLLLQQLQMICSCQLHPGSALLDQQRP